MMPESWFRRLGLWLLLWVLLPISVVHPLPQTSKQFDDAEIVESADTASGSVGSAGGILSAITNPSSLGSITSPDGPGPSILGSLDNIFKSMQDFDQYRCIERMVCEYMQEGSSEADTIGDIVSSSSQLLGGNPASLASVASQSARPTRFASPPQAFGPPPQFGPPPPQFGQPSQFGPSGFVAGPNPSPFGFDSSFRPPPPGRRIAQSSEKPGFLESFFNLIGSGSTRRSKRQTSNMQGNIIRLFQATKLDNLKAFPYIRAALIGYSAKSHGGSGNLVRRGSSPCSQMYRECPTDSNRILNYLNNHNGGLVNQVSPSVDNEVGTILSAIVSQAMADKPTTPSPTFAAADSFLTTAVANGAGGLLGSFAQNILKYVNRT